MYRIESSRAIDPCNNGKIIHIVHITERSWFLINFITLVDRQEGQAQYKSLIYNILFLNRRKSRKTVPLCHFWRIIKKGDLLQGGRTCIRFKAEKLSENIFLMDVHAQRVASHCEPGQFVIVRWTEGRIRLLFVIMPEKPERLRSRGSGSQTSTVKMSELKAGDSFRDFVGPLDVPLSLLRKISKV